MARNEEKQLARLNRWYLQKQREDEEKKRPPRPKLESLNKAEDVKMWIPTITRDIEFYVKQMEVPCYPDHVIADFDKRINHLRGEYKAFLSKLRQLCPEETTTPWSDRPYTKKRKKLMDASADDVETKSDNANPEGSPAEDLSKDFIPLKTPVLDNDKDYRCLYGYKMPTSPPTQCDIDEESQNQPLELMPIPKPEVKRIKAIGLPENYSWTSHRFASKALNPPLPISDSTTIDEIKGFPAGIAVMHNDNGEPVPSLTPRYISHGPKFIKDNGWNESSQNNTHVIASTSLSLNLPYSDSSSSESDENT